MKNKHVKRLFIFLAIFIAGIILVGITIINRPVLSPAPMPTIPPGVTATPPPPAVLASPSITSIDPVAIIGALGGLIGSIGAVISAYAAIITARKAH